MKKVLAMALVGVLCVGTLAGCGSSSGSDSTADTTGDEVSAAEETEEAAETTEESGDGPTIAISCAAATTGWTAAISYYAEKYCEENDINYILVTAESSNEQANQIDDLISQNPDAIVLHPMNDELATAAQTIMDAGILLVDYDRTLGDTTPDYYLAGSNYENGKKGADWLVEQLGTDFTVAECTVTSNGNIMVERINGFEDELAEIAPDVTIVGQYASEGCSQEEGLSLVADVLSGNPDLDAIFLVDDELAAGGLQAIKESGRDDIKALFACGGGSSVFTNQIKDSSFPIATVSYYPTMIDDAIDMALAALNGEDVDSEVIVDGVVIDATTLDEWKESEGVDENAPY